MSIYFDNAASTWPKPQQVQETINKYLNQYSTNINYLPAKTEELNPDLIVHKTKALLVNLFQGTNPNNIFFTPNCTTAISIALNNLIKPGDHVLTSSMEHNSIVQQLENFREKGIEITKIPCSLERGLSPLYVENVIKNNTKMIILTHGSNVTGTLNPVKDIGQVAQAKGILFMVDCAQTAGICPINVEEMAIDLLAFSGHKHLMGPQGIGGLYIGNKLSLDLFADVELGTANIPGIAGLGAAVKFIQEIGMEKIWAHRENLVKYLSDGLKKIPGILIYGQEKSSGIGIVSFNIKGLDPHIVAEILKRNYQITTQSGLHQAPDTHKFMGTYPQGAVRVSFSFFNTIAETDTLLNAVKSIARECA